MVAYAFNHSTQEAGAGRLLWVQSQSSLHIESYASWGYSLRPYLKTENKTKQVLLKDISLRASLSEYAIFVWTRGL